MHDELLDEMNGLKFCELQETNSCIKSCPHLVDIQSDKSYHLCNIEFSFQYAIRYVCLMPNRLFHLISSFVD